MTDPERVPRIIARLMNALDYDDDAVIHAAWNLLDIRLSDLPTKQLRRRFQSLRDRFAPATKRPRKPAMPADRSKVKEETREFIIEIWMQSKISSKLIHGLCPSCSTEKKSVVLASHVDQSEISHDVWCVEILRILQCTACSTLYSKNEDIDHLSNHPLVENYGSALHSTGLPRLASTITHWVWLALDRSSLLNKEQIIGEMTRTIPPLDKITGR